MRIDPSLPKPPKPASLDVRSPAVQRFADLLDDQSGRDRVASFAELSMFGRPRATAASARPSPATAAFTPARNGAEPLPAGPPTTAASSCAQPRPTASGRSGQPLHAVQRTLPARTAQDPASDKRPPPEAASESLPPQSPDAPVESEPLRRARSRLRQAALKAGISLILCEEDGAVRLVIGGSPLDPEQGSSARRLAERILAESGLELAHFQLNGAAVGTNSTGQKGGRHGTRSD